MLPLAHLPAFCAPARTQRAFRHGCGAAASEAVGRSTRRASRLRLLLAEQQRRLPSWALVFHGGGERGTWLLLFLGLFAPRRASVAAERYRGHRLTCAAAPASGLAPDIPEDLYHLIKKAVSVRKHLERNRKDRDSKFRLILIESRIHRLARYYRLAKKLPPNWRYESATASAMVA